MKHLLLLIVGFLTCYGAWHFTKPLERPGGRLLIKHGLRIAAYVAILLALLGVAYSLPSLNIL